MGVLCPKHHIELKIEPITLSIAGRLFSATIGICPQCTAKYINRVLFNGGNTFSIDNIRYEYLQGLSTAFPLDPLADAKLEEERLEQQRKEELERQKKLAEQRNKELKEQQKKKEEERKRAADIRRKKIAESRRKAEKEKQRKEQDYQNKFKKYEQNRRKKFRPAFVAYFEEIPQQCPYDSKSLIFLQNVQTNITKSKKGFCCLYCSRLFLLDQKTIHSRNNLNKRKSGDHPFKMFSKEETQSHDYLKANSIYALSPSDIPSSTILIAQLQEEENGDIGFIVVVADVNDQDTKNGIYWIGRTLSAMILAALQINPKKIFNFKGKTYCVQSFEAYHDTEKYLEVISRFCNPNSPQTVYLFAQKNIAQYNNQNYEMVTAMIPCAGNSFPVPINVYYDKVANQYFINEATYKSIQKDYGLPYLRLRPAASEVKAGIYGGLKTQSELRLYGYSVSASDGAPLESRRQLLRSLIDNGIMTKHEVINHIEWLITSRRNMNHMENAISKWQSDLMFITGYRVSDQNMIWVRTLRTKYTDVRFGI